MKTLDHRWQIAAAVLTAAIALGLCLAAPALAQKGAQWPEPEPVPEQEILDRLAQVSPGAVPHFRLATQALQAEEWLVARVGYKKVLSMAPGFPDALRRMSYVAQGMGEPDAAVEYAQQAYDADPCAINEYALADALLERGTPADHVAGYRHAQAAAQALPNYSQAQVTWFLGALANEEEDGMRQASAALVRVAPGNPVSHYCAGISAAADGRWEQAEREMLLAQELGLPAEAVEEALDNGIRAQTRLRRVLKGGAYSVAGWLAGLGALAAVGVVFSGLTMAAVRRTQASGEFHVGRVEGVLRGIYRAIIAIVSVYYYVSIPFLIVIVLALLAGIGYLFLIIGHIPIRIALLVAAAGLYTLFSIVRSLFLRRREGDPGRPLPREEAPGLWALTERVAGRVGTRPVDAIYVTPSTDLGVTERGGMWQRLRGGGERALVLGLGALPGMTQGQFQAILAHEYGHFSNRDTAGGDLAGRVRASVYAMAHGLAASGQARWYNPAWLFVNGFYRIYLRITLGASRLQEILADRYAAVAYGAANLVAGLQHTIHQELVFQAGANREIKASIDQARQLRNLYSLPLDEGAGLPDDLADAEAKILERPTSAYDSHPAPRDRIALLQRLGAAGSGDDVSEPVWDLFPDPEALQEEMTGQVAAAVQAMAARSG